LREANAIEERLYQAQKMEVGGQLTGGIAHDFNNMVQAVGGCLTLIERRIASGRLDAIDRLVEQMRRALNSTAAPFAGVLAPASLASRVPAAHPRPGDRAGAEPRRRQVRRGLRRPPARSRSCSI